MKRLSLRSLLPLAALALGLPLAPAQGAELGPHQINLAVTPLAQKSLRQGDSNANIEVDLTGYLRLSPGSGDRWGATRLEFWLLGTDTLGKTRSTSDFSQRAGLLWDSNDGDSPDPHGSLAVAALAQDIQAGGTDLTFKLGKLYPSNEIGVSDYYGDDRDSFFSTLLSSEMAGRWSDLIGLGLKLGFTRGQTYGGFLIVDATAEADLLDFNSLKNGDFLYAAELGQRFRLGGRAARASLIPYAVDQTDGLDAEQGLSLAFEHDLSPARTDAPADLVMFGRYTAHRGGDSRNKQGEDGAKPLDHGGFLGLALNRPFGQEAQQIGLAMLYGAPSDLSKERGFDAQYGLETYWKITPNRFSAFSLGLLAQSRRGGGVEFLPGIRFKIHM